MSKNVVSDLNEGYETLKTSRKCGGEDEEDKNSDKIIEGNDASRSTFESRKNIDSDIAFSDFAESLEYTVR